MARPTQDVQIDKDCILIGGSAGICGRVNGNNPGQNIHCANNNSAGDGFVYTSSTKKSGNGYAYQYTGIDMGNEVDKVGGAVSGDPDEKYRAPMIYRSKDTFEGNINYAKYKGGQQFNGGVTDSSEFYYNEGMQGDGADGSNDRKAEGLEGNTNFYDQNTRAFSDQLVKVRML